MSSKMIGMDVGATGVRAVEIAGVGPDGFAVVTKIGIAPLPEGAIVGGRVRSPERVAAAMVKALKNGGISRYGVVLGLATPDVNVTKMLLPASVRSDERLTAVRALGRPIAPTLALEDSALTCALVDVHTAPDGVSMATIDVVAARQTDLDGLLEAARLAKITLKAVDLTGAALVRGLSRANPAYGEVGTVIDIGATKVTVATRQGSILRSVRTTLGGGNDLSRAIMQITGETMAEAELRKFGMRVGSTATAVSIGGYVDDADDYKMSRTPTQDALDAAVDMLVESIGQSVEADAANHGTYTQAVTMCGGSTLLRGLKDRLQARVGVPVSIGRPWVDVERTKRNAAYFVEGRPDPRVLLSISAAAGLALWREPS